jgi:hypothetical protein
MKRKPPFNMASKRAREVAMLVLYRHRGLPDTDDRDIYLEMAAHHLSPKDGDLIFALDNWARRLGATLPECELREVASRIEKKRLKFGSDTIGKKLRVTYNERSAIKLTTIGCYDVSKAERAQLRKQRDRLRHQARRRQSGATPRDQYLANSLSRQRPWLAESISRATWYRRHKTAKQIRVSLPLPVGRTPRPTHSEPAVARRPTGRSPVRTARFESASQGAAA